MNIRRAAVIFVLGFLAASCSETATEISANKTEAPGQPVGASEAEPPPARAAPPPPSDGDIGRDCAAFVRSTRVVSAQRPSAGCPACPAASSDALTFHGAETKAVSCSGETCDVVVTIRASFVPGAGEAFAGGLTAWIPPEQRRAYLGGDIPSEEQTYRVRITYERRGESWQALKFDRAPGE